MSTPKQQYTLTGGYIVHALALLNVLVPFSIVLAVIVGSFGKNPHTRIARNAALNAVLTVLAFTLPLVLLEMLLGGTSAWPYVLLGIFQFVWVIFLLIGSITGLAKMSSSKPCYNYFGMLRIVQY